jgi:hypothetical protein
MTKIERKCEATGCVRPAVDSRVELHAVPQWRRSAGRGPHEREVENHRRVWFCESHRAAAQLSLSHAEYVDLTLGCVSASG